MREHYDPAAERAQIEIAARRAEGYGMRAQNAIATFVVATFVTGERFDEYPLIGQILNDSSYSPDDRMRVLQRRLDDHEWEAAREYCRSRSRSDG